MSIDKEKVAILVNEIMKKENEFLNIKSLPESKKIQNIKEIVEEVIR
ncbi:hypothetical protein [Clostridium chromiireducens]|uniref:Uncharacterized protein n=1 Tax=Clostridium chromiireducens TaxID=225345 RepID=A0A1V4I821_9CLOT|nr:hypothetical protein [Clostridium chromiireducens]OPJ56116.1 hypothetical protein CLCHR_45960 [Clostridium chromiireducens]